MGSNIPLVLGRWKAWWVVAACRPGAHRVLGKVSFFVYPSAQ